MEFPRLPLAEVRRLVEEFGVTAVDDALAQVRRDGLSDSATSNSSANSDDYDNREIREAMLEASFDANFAVNDRGIIRHVNRAAVEKFGYDSHDEMIGKNISVIVGGGHAEHHDSYLANYKETRHKTLIGSFREVSGRRRDGTEFPCKIYIQVIESHSARRRHRDKLLYYASLHDISTEKRVEELRNRAIRDQKLRSAILDVAFDSMFATDVLGEIQMVNKIAVESFGYSSEAELVGQNIKCIVGGVLSERHVDFLNLIRETREERFIGTMRELSATSKDGTEFPVIVGLQIVDKENDDGDDPIVVAFVRDITQQKAAEKLKQQTDREQRIRSAILDASFDSMFAVNLHGIIQMANKAASATFGYDDSELLGQNINIIVGGDDARHHDDYLAAYRKTGKQNIIGSMREVIARRKNGEEFPVVLGIEKIDQGVASATDEMLSEPLLVAFVRDMTEHKKAMAMEIEIRSAEDLLFNMLPKQIANRLKDAPGHLADHYESATILFADIVGFTALSSGMSPMELVKILNELFTKFDTLVECYGLNKVKTIGDCYMVTSIPSYHAPERAPSAMCLFALDMIAAMNVFNKEYPGNKLNIRIGINTGPVVAGVVGTSRFLYDLWGDTVNVASRMESSGVPSRVHVTKAVVDGVEPGHFAFEARGEVDVKGKGLMETYFLTETTVQPKEYFSSNLAAARRPSALGAHEGTLQAAIKALQSQMNASFTLGEEETFS